LGLYWVYAVCFLFFLVWAFVYVLLAVVVDAYRAAKREVANDEASVDSTFLPDVYDSLRAPWLYWSRRWPKPAALRGALQAACEDSDAQVVSMVQFQILMASLGANCADELLAHYRRRCGDLVIEENAEEDGTEREALGANLGVHRLNFNREAAGPPDVRVRPYGLLGVQQTLGGGMAKIDAEPGPGVAIVDPAGLPFIQSSPGGAGGAAGVVYEWLGIRRTPSFPDAVRNAIKAPLQAKFQAYGDKLCIHVVGPDFQAQRCSREEALDQLAEAYRAVFAEFAASGCAGLRLLPISGGIFAGCFAGNLPDLSAEALHRGFEMLQPDQQLPVCHAEPLEMCIFRECELSSFELALAKAYQHAKARTRRPAVLVDNDDQAEPEDETLRCGPPAAPVSGNAWEVTYPFGVKVRASKSRTAQVLRVVPRGAVVRARLCVEQAHTKLSMDPGGSAASKLRGSETWLELLDGTGAMLADAGLHGYAPLLRRVPLNTLFPTLPRETGEELRDHIIAFVEQHMGEALQHRWDTDWEAEAARIACEAVSEIPKMMLREASAQKHVSTPQGTASMGPRKAAVGSPSSAQPALLAPPPLAARRHSSGSSASTALAASAAATAVGDDDDRQLPATLVAVEKASQFGTVRASPEVQTDFSAMPPSALPSAFPSPQHSPPIIGGQASVRANGLGFDYLSAYDVLPGVMPDFFAGTPSSRSESEESC